MAAKRKIRRKLRRKSPAVRRAPDATAKAARSDAKSSALMVGGALDPAEKAADRMAANALSRGAVSVSGAASTANSGALHRDAAVSPSVAPGAQIAAAPKEAVDAVNGLGAGRGLSASERRYFEPRFGRDFSSVRVHEGAAADRANSSLDAKAFTIGNDIAFSEGAHDWATAAHELAHVTRNDGGLRRFIDPGPDFASQMESTLISDYGVQDVKPLGNLLTNTKSSTTPDLTSEIAETMLSSQRVFTLKGSTGDEVENSLSSQVNARLGVVGFAKNIRVDFTAGTPRIDDAKWQVFRNEVDKVREETDQKLKAEGVSQEDRADWLRSRIADIVVAALNETITSAELKDMLDDVKLKSKEYEASEDPGKVYPYAMACLDATFVVMAGGGRSAVIVNMLDEVVGTKDNMTAMTWNDWIPGDWGYIENTGTDTPGAGLEGENIVSLGQGQFWAHFDPDQPIQPLSGIFDMVEGWNGGAALSSLRIYPKAGLT